MKIQSLLIAAVALIVGLSACNKEETLSQDGAPVNAVRFTASVGNPFAATRSNPVGTVEEQAKFNIGDEIVIDKATIGRGAPISDKIVYKFDGTSWVPNNNYLLWIYDYESFTAHYPIDEDGFFIDYVQEDQSTLPLLTKSDLMSANILDAAKGTALNFVMERQTSRIIVKIAGFNAEFSGESNVAEVNIISQVGPLDQDYYERFTPYVQGDGSEGTTYTLLINGRHSRHLYVQLKVGNKEMHSAGLTSRENGKSYTYNLIVGKEKLEIESVTVADWSNTVTLDDGEAGERE